MVSELLAAVGAVATREVTMQEPVVTWNLFLTAFLVPTCSAISSGIIIGYISWRNRKKEKKDREIDALKLAIEEEKLKNTAQWRKNHTEVLCKVKERVDNIYTCLDKKVDKDDCDRLMGNTR